MNARPAVGWLVVGALATAVGHYYWPQPRPSAAATKSNSSVTAPALADAINVETAHYLIASTAEPAQTALVAGAVESLHGAYTAFFRDRLPQAATPTKLKLVLYKNRQQFQAHNQSSP